MGVGVERKSGADAARTSWRRTTLSALVVLALLVSFAWFENAPWRPSRATPTPAVDHLTAAAAQQGQPTTAAEARAAIDRDLAGARARLGADAVSWSDHAAVGSLLLARARLTGSFDDYTDAGRAFEVAFRIARPGVGPHLDRAAWNMATHRLSAIAPDLDAVERYALPDDAEIASALGFRGDIAFYTGRYAQALALYTRAQARLPTVGGDLRLANYHARMGAPARAVALLDQAESRITGPQQQLRAFIELRRGVLARDRGRWDEAERRFRRADDIFPGYWIVEEQLATMRALNGAPDEAMAIFRRIADRDGLPDAYDGVAGLYRAQGDVDNAQRWAAKAGALWDRRVAQLPEAALGHALDHLLAFGDPARALEVARRNHAVRPYGDAATGLASAYLANHRPADALSALAPTLASGWTSAEAHIVASQAHALLAQGKQADAERRKALAINPHSADRNPAMMWLEP